MHFVDMSFFKKLKKLLNKEELDELEDDDLEIEEESVETVENTSTDVDRSLLEWKSTVEAISKHPLTQAKVVNDQLLASLTRVLESIDYKLDKLDKLDEILRLLKKGQEKLEKEGVEVPEIKQAIQKLEQPLKEKEVLELLKQYDMLSAEEVAERLGISRSTASYRLNRLVRQGLVEKVSQGRKVYFKIKIFD